MIPGLADCLRIDGDDVFVSVRVQPRARKNEIRGVVDGRLQLRTTAPPTDGKANAAIARAIAELFGIPPSRVELRRGQTHRDKLFVLRGPVPLPPADYSRDGANRV